jgi:Permuted papain-like amidase enzyme, YaeF/YiiX, C92 family
MATPIKKTDIKRLTIQPYETLRETLRTGDIVFCSGSYVFSGLIQKFTGSVWSHVGIIYRDDTLGRVFILESETGIGVRLVPLSKYLRDYHGRRRPYRGQIVIGRIEPELALVQVNPAYCHAHSAPSGAAHTGPQIHLFRISRRVLSRGGRQVFQTGELH